ncbi:MAG TPA: exodeoxyribonuclease VII large subunit [Oscillospiraceae bacterium]|mgnify:CR=1 FL=1|nr:exodeoxyribonuclease VII large subunit [Oscillospiraceae bacterium]HPF55635.1 exodeoxyribonuclease VII large subunit [Clostridiales bacterium]HPK34202.1 exodeoxyribonuclease VII large subunit [Oscillospiraceae bacterium]HPR74895.1 exodeoxyribonuclease VII large subunit [Oscillospiraceae bacterium]
MSIALTVTQLNTYLKAVMDSDDLLRSVFVTGEILNFTRHFKTGHLYFTLKDGNSAIKCVMFAPQTKRLKFTPSDGLAVIVNGRVSLFERDSNCQIYVENISPNGAGVAKEALKKLFEKLNAEHLFDEAQKLSLPKYPNKAAVITSASGAAYQDVVSVWKRRWPLCELELIPATVQGEQAVTQICAALKKLQKTDADVILLTRGGGSDEDLWLFNDEELVRTVAASNIPIVSAVGHDIDYTLCDMAASMRAATPTAAAELVFPDWREVNRIIDLLSFDNAKAINAQLVDYEYRINIDLSASLNVLLSVKRQQWIHQCEKLEALSPVSTLLRGYTIAISDGEPVQSAKEMKLKKDFDLKFFDGEVPCKVRTEESK